MNISVGEGGVIEVTEVYSGIKLKSNDGEIFGICMRDSGFEFQYNGIWYEAKEGQIKKLGKVC